MKKVQFFFISLFFYSLTPAFGEGVILYNYYDATGRLQILDGYDKNSIIKYDVFTSGHSDNGIKSRILRSKMKLLTTAKKVHRLSLEVRRPTPYWMTAGGPYYFETYKISIDKTYDNKYRFLRKMKAYTLNVKDNHMLLTLEDSSKTVRFKVLIEILPNGSLEIVKAKVKHLDYKWRWKIFFYKISETEDIIRGQLRSQPRYVFGHHFPIGTDYFLFRDGKLARLSKINKSQETIEITDMNGEIQELTLSEMRNYISSVKEIPFRGSAIKLPSGQSKYIANISDLLGGDPWNCGIVSNFYYERGDKISFIKNSKGQYQAEIFNRDKNKSVIYKDIVKNNGAYVQLDKYPSWSEPIGGIYFYAAGTVEGFDKYDIIVWSQMHSSDDTFTPATVVQSGRTVCMREGIQ